MDWIDGTDYLESALVLGTICMSPMMPLRAAASCSVAARFARLGREEFLPPYISLKLLLSSISTFTLFNL